MCKRKVWWLSGNVRSNEIGENCSLPAIRSSRGGHSTDVDYCSTLLLFPCISHRLMASLDHTGRCADLIRVFPDGHHNLLNLHLYGHLYSMLLYVCRAPDEPCTRCRNPHPVVWAPQSLDLETLFTAHCVSLFCVFKFSSSSS